MRNQLLLLEDIANVGRKGDLVTVKPGFSRNYLLPQKKAIIADKSVIKIQARLKEERAKQDLRDQLEHKTFTYKVNVDPDGKLYGSVSAKQIVEILAQEGFEIERRMVSLDQSIKQLGTYTIMLKLKEGVSASFSLRVEPDQEGLKIMERAEITKAQKEAQAKKEAADLEQSQDEEEPFSKLST
jgi:large subunit ribosomal protein L9